MSSSFYSTLSISTYRVKRESELATKASSENDDDNDSGLSSFPGGASKHGKILRLFNMALMALVLVGFGTCNSLFAPFFPTEAVRRGVSATTVGLIFGTYTLTMFIVSLGTGFFTRTLGPHFMIGAGTFLSSGSTILFGLLDQAPPGDSYVAICFAARMVEGLGASLYNIAAYSIAAILFPKSVSTSYAVLESSIGAGTMLGPTIGGALFNAGGFSLPFYVLGAILLVVGILSMIALRLTLPASTLANHDENQHVDSIVKIKTKKTQTNKNSSSSSLTWRNLFRASYEIWILSAVLIAGAIALGFTSPTLALYLESLGLTDAFTVGLVFLSGSLCYTVFAVLVGKIADIFSKYAYLIMMLGAILLSIGYFFIGPIPPIHSAVPPSVGLTIGAYVVLGASFAIIINPVPIALFSAVRSAGFADSLDTSSMIAGLYNAAWYLGLFFGNPLAGLLMDTLGFEWASFIISILGVFLIPLLCLGELIRRRNSSSTYSKYYENDTAEYSILTSQAPSLSSKSQPNKTKLSSYNSIT